MPARSTARTDTDALFKLPLEEFTSARNALVAQLKKAGKRAEADEVKALTKPSVSAWAVNQLYWRHGDLFGRLLKTGDRLRKAGQLTSDATRDAAHERRELVTALAGIAADLLRDGNNGATHVVRRVASTLEALSSYGSLAGAPAAGRLSDDVEPPGFEALAGIVPSKAPAKPARRAEPSGAASSNAKNERKRLLAEAKAAVRTAEKTLRAARNEAERAATKESAAAKSAKSTEDQRARLEKQLARAAADAATARKVAGDAAAKAAAATRALEGAELALEQARLRLEQLNDVRG